MSREQHVGFVIHQMDNLVNRTRVALGLKTGVDEMTTMNGWIIAYLCRNADRDIFQRDLERELSLAKSTITCILKPMEQKGYIERVSVASDARLKKLVVTEKGREMHHICYDNMIQMEQTLRNGLTEEELQTFFTIMGKMRDNVEQLSCQIKNEERKNDTK